MKLTLLAKWITAGWAPRTVLHQLFKRNIARGTTDPEIDSITWIELGKNMAPLTLVAYLTTTWRHLQIWPPVSVGTTCISSKFGHQMVPLALVANMATRWRHLRKLQIWPPDGAIYIS